MAQIFTLNAVEHAEINLEGKWPLEEPVRLTNLPMKTNLLSLVLCLIIYT